MMRLKPNEPAKPGVIVAVAAAHLDNLVGKDLVLVKRVDSVAAAGSPAATARQNHHQHHQHNQSQATAGADRHEQPVQLARARRTSRPQVYREMEAD